MSINNTKYANSTYNGEKHLFLEVNYNDWCEANYGIYPLLYSKGLLNEFKFLEVMLGLILCDYKFMQAFIYIENDHLIVRNLDIAKRHLQYVKYIFSLDNDTIIKYIDKCADKTIKVVDKMAMLYIQQEFENKYTLQEWLEYLDNVYNKNSSE